MLRKLLTFICIILPMHAYALSCPNNGDVLQTGYTLEQVMQHCGKPVSTNNYTTTKNDSEELIYYKNNINSDNIKVTVLVNNDRVANIHIVTNPKQCTNATSSNDQSSPPKTVTTCPPTEQNVNSSSVCGRLIQIGSGINYVRSACGTPAEQKTLQTTTTQVSELTYSGAGPNVLVFENGTLTDWKN